MKATAAVAAVLLVAAAGCSSTAHNAAVSTVVPVTTIVETTTIASATTVIETTVAPVTTIVETTTIAPATTVIETTVAPAPAVACVHSALVFGEMNRKPEVAALQRALNARSFWTGDVDGEFGPNTGEGMAKWFYAASSTGEPMVSGLSQAFVLWTEDLVVTLPVFKQFGIACADYDSRDMYGDGTPL